MQNNYSASQVAQETFQMTNLKFRISVYVLWLTRLTNLKYLHYPNSLIVHAAFSNYSCQAKIAKLCLQKASSLLSYKKSKTSQQKPPNKPNNHLHTNNIDFYPVSNA